MPDDAPTNPTILRPAVVIPSPLVLEFELAQDEVLNANHSLHHAVKARKTKHLRQLARDRGESIHHGNSGYLFDSFAITVRVHPPTNRRLDSANTYPSIKAMIDGGTDARLWVDDDDEHLRALTFLSRGPKTGVPGLWRFVLTIEAVVED